MAVGERVLAGRAFVNDRRNVAEKSGGHGVVSSHPRSIASSGRAGEPRAALTGRPGSGQVTRANRGRRLNATAPNFVVAVDPVEPPPALRRAVYAIGNFDGVHRGHQAVLGLAGALAAKAGVASAALTFEPHPADFFAGRPVVFRLTPFAQKAAAIAQCGAGGVVSLSFDGALASLSAEAFVEDVLVRQLDLSAVVVGADFHFGKGRSGSPEFLRRAGERFGFDVAFADKVEEGAEAISSTAIRRALERGDVQLAAHMLGRRYRVGGPVIGGQKLGRTLGVPTANVALEPTNRLAFGVYAVQARLGERRLGGVASFGVRPTVDDGAPLLETFLFDFDEEIYGRTLEVDFVAYIRPELKFDGLEPLKRAMADDIAAAREALRATP
ncbi:MAG: bifunctional riboflavin kinase/FAD synthetase [Pseudomonadota bacterium]|nr:bifunctional riboflavin kinase/FAD synthetase [Pseudomonadota bacterium]